jgi:hypothetical protein
VLVDDVGKTGHRADVEQRAENNRKNCVGDQKPEQRRMIVDGKPAGEPQTDGQGSEKHQPDCRHHDGRPFVEAPVETRRIQEGTPKAQRSTDHEERPWCRA